jgi:AcrR family transcriptional regulator
MARKPRTKRPRRAAKAAGAGARTRRGGAGTAGASGDAKSRIVAAALKLAAERRWCAVTLGDIAKAARMPIAELLAALPSKPAILAELQRQTDRIALGGDPAEGDARERLFELLMRRFDALAPHRAGLRSIARAAPVDPLGTACAYGQLLHSMRLMLAGAGLPADGLAGMVAAPAVAGIYLSVMPVFLAEEETDQARTMAALDRRLRRLDQAAGWLKARMPRRTA